MNEKIRHHSRQTYVEGKGEVYCGLPRNRKCPRHPAGFKFPGKKKCKGCPYARYRKVEQETEVEQK